MTDVQEGNARWKHIRTALILGLIFYAVFLNLASMPSYEIPLSVATAMCVVVIALSLGEFRRPRVDRQPILFLEFAILVALAVAANSVSRLAR